MCFFSYNFLWYKLLEDYLQKKRNLENALRKKLSEQLRKEWNHHKENHFSWSYFSGISFKENFSFLMLLPLIVYYEIVIVSKCLMYFMYLML